MENIGSYAEGQVSSPEPRAQAGAAGLACGRGSVSEVCAYAIGSVRFSRLTGVLFWVWDGAFKWTF